MEKIKRSISLMLVLSMVFLLAACSSNTQNKSIYEHGIELISLMEEMAESESYLELYSGISELQEIVFGVSNGDYTEPKAVYKIEVSDDVISYIAEEEGVDIDKLSDNLREYFVSDARTAVVSQVNARGGADLLAAAAAVTAKKVFISDEITETIVYLYTYENAVPAFVTFTPGEDGAVLASGSFIFYEDFMTDTAEDIEQFFAEIGTEVEVEPVMDLIIAL